MELRRILWPLTIEGLRTTVDLRGASNSCLFQPYVKQEVETIRNPDRVRVWKLQRKIGRAANAAVLKTVVR